MPPLLLGVFPLPVLLRLLAEPGVDGDAFAALPPLPPLPPLAIAGDDEDDAFWGVILLRGVKLPPVEAP